MNAINARIQLLIEHYANGNNSRFAGMIGISEANVRNYLKGTQPKFDFIAAIAEKFEINYEWLLLGKGTMHAANTAAHRTKPEKRLVEEQEVPLYEIRSAADAMSIFEKNKKQIPADYIRIPGIPKCDGAVPVTGDSMSPLLKAGDIVLYRIIHDISMIIWGEMYLIDIEHKGDRYFFTKYIRISAKKGHVMLASESRHHTDIELPAGSIKGLAIINATIRINQVI